MFKGTVRTTVSYSTRSFVDTAAVRMWDIAGTDQILKLEKKAIGGGVNDLAWDGESKRIIVVGEGRDKYGAAFQFDTGSSAGEITGHSKALNSVVIRQQRPFRCAIVGDDGLLVFHQGPPYKYLSTLNAHPNFVHSVAYAPSGSDFVSTSADYKVFLWDGTSGEHVAEVENAHKGGSWSPDSTDRDLLRRLHRDVDTRKAITTWTLGSDIAFHQLGNTWTSKNSIVSVSLDSVFNVFDPRNDSGPARSLHGARKPITAATLVLSPPTFFAGSGDGRIHSLSLESDTVERSVGYDDKAKEIDVGSSSFSKSAFVQTTSQPRGISISSQDGHVFLAEAKHVEVLKSSQKVTAVDTKYVALSTDVYGDLVAVGGDTEDSTHIASASLDIHIYIWSIEKINKNIPIKNAVPGGAWGIRWIPESGDANGKLIGVGSDAVVRVWEVTFHV
ncbi:hypothetical protein M422DRAFT_260362 [Sphaerobolus stellatus SS14]|uniref:Actin-interacting protein 1 n=1 Tax=Sphaerobolus stellatus (strain SS14) TaxID=990650 RepID=A0A0C9U2W3_SPHS4|nr:hypothetical protein M422DRAFT_260362 [Sphaerobolus stellatus SS14]